MKKNVLTLNAISPIINDYLKSDDYTITDNVAAPDAILVRSAKMHDMDLDDSLLCIGRAGAGVNNIPVDNCSKKGIVVFNTPGANANGVKELVICGLLLSGRRVIDAANWAQGLKGEGDAVKALVEKGKKQFVGPELAGKKLGIIGMGAIGAMVANAALALDMDVTGYDPFMSVESALSLSRAVKRTTDLDALLKDSDYISIHVPLMDQTKHMFNADVFGKVKDGLVLLNFSRNELVDNKALIDALASGKVRKYVIDFPTEELLQNENIIALPHLGASTPESEENCAAMAAQQIDDYLKNGNITNSVNFPAVSMPRSGANRLCIIHQNVAGMVGQISSLLAAESHNITNMINKSRGNYAYTMLDLDDAPTDSCLDKLSSIDGVLRTRSL